MISFKLLVRFIKDNRVSTAEISHPLVLLRVLLLCWLLSHQNSNSGFVKYMVYLMSS